MIDKKVIAANKLYIQDVTEIDTLTFLSRLTYGILLRDRFGMLDSGSKYNLSAKADAIPTPSEFITLGECFNTAAEDLHSKYAQVFAVYKGSQLSAAMISALARIYAPGNLTILMKESDQVKSEIFYNKLLADGHLIQTFSTEDALWKYASEVETGAVITSDCGNAVLGIFPRNFQRTILNLPWLEGINVFWKNITNATLSEASLKIIEEKVKNYASMFNIELTSLAEVIALFGFGCKFERDRHMPKFLLKNSNNVGIAFFDHPKFESYFLSTFSNIKNLGYVKTVNQTTRLIKHYTIEYTNDPLYLYKDHSYFLEDIKYPKQIQILFEDGSLDTYEASQPDLKLFNTETLKEILK